MTTLLITGSREATPAMLDYARRCVDRAFELNYEIIVGDAEGVDECVMKHAHALGAMCIVYGANGKLRRQTTSCSPEIVAGNYLARDKAMALACDRCIAIWNGHSRGTMHTLNYAKAAGKECWLKDFSKEQVP